MQLMDIIVLELRAFRGEFGSNDIKCALLGLRNMPTDNPVVNEMMHFLAYKLKTAGKVYTYDISSMYHSLKLMYSGASGVNKFAELLALRLSSNIELAVAGIPTLYKICVILSSLQNIGSNPKVLKLTLEALNKTKGASIETIPIRPKNVCDAISGMVNSSSNGSDAIEILEYLRKKMVKLEDNFTFQYIATAFSGLSLMSPQNETVRLVLIELTRRMREVITLNKRVKAPIQLDVSDLKMILNTTVKLMNTGDPITVDILKAIEEAIVHNIGCDRNSPLQGNIASFYNELATMGVPLSSICKRMEQLPAVSDHTNK